MIRLMRLTDPMDMEYARALARRYDSGQTLRELMKSERRSFNWVRRRVIMFTVMREPGRRIRK
jgi:hypothetical protein